MNLSLISILSVVCVGFFGWVANIVKLLYLFDGPINGWLIGRAVGVFFAPPGAVLGFF